MCIDSSILILRNDIAGSDAMFFNRSWAEFKLEFGSPSSQYWIGLDRLHQLSQMNCRARFDMGFSRFAGLYYAQYSTFLVGNSTDKYKLTIGGFSGDLIDAMNSASGTLFTTYDVNNNPPYGNCAVKYGGGFWYRFGLCAYARVTASPNSYFLWNSLIYDLAFVELRLLC